MGDLNFWQPQVANSNKNLYTDRLLNKVSTSYINSGIWIIIYSLTQEISNSDYPSRVWALISKLSIFSSKAWVSTPHEWCEMIFKENQEIWTLKSPQFEAGFISLCIIVLQISQQLLQSKIFAFNWALIKRVSMTMILRSASCSGGESFWTAATQDRLIMMFIESHVFKMDPSNWLLVHRIDFLVTSSMRVKL